LAFDRAGLSVFNGGVSTFLAIVPLAASESYVFIVFFKSWLAIILFGTGNALILLPCCLYFASPLI
jgi:hypothetical protein